MTVLELKERKTRLRDELTAAVHRFEKETGAEVTMLMPRHRTDFKLAAGEVTHSLIAVDVEVRV